MTGFTFEQSWPGMGLYWALHIPFLLFPPFVTIRFLTKPKGMFVRASKLKRFKFHPKCSALNLCHLAFADDLFILSSVDHDSLQLISALLTDFLSFSGLKPNANKSVVFYGGVDEPLKRQMQSVLPFPEGSFPIKYLGVLLIST
ncbi:hypothetical protein RHMOL_Rhmol11G0167600 [Rhododendron molle]|uniref:Uncharacterized protein n=1 Tax=Rhododendron molle TaxID=49168 RepID=A0ACC0LTC9_RHOML|nr:hypothetical protein RHMOL_Rhmol11G0167600 [Rhododendron molle]